jgi:hypothetical protein
MKKPRGILVTVLNYEKFQNLKNYERANEGQDEGTEEELRDILGSLSINKNDKKEKNDQLLVYVIASCCVPCEF